MGGSRSSVQFASRLFEAASNGYDSAQRGYSTKGLESTVAGKVGLECLGGLRTHNGLDILRQLPCISFLIGSVVRDNERWMIRLGRDFRLLVRSPLVLSVAEGIDVLRIVRITHIADELLIGYLGVSLLCSSCKVSAWFVVIAVQDIT